MQTHCVDQWRRKSTSVAIPTCCVNKCETKDFASDRMYNASNVSRLQSCSHGPAQHRSTRSAQLSLSQKQASFMPAVNRRTRPEATAKQAAQNCARLLSVSSHQLVKVRSIGAADAVGDSEVQVRREPSLHIMIHDVQRAFNLTACKVTYSVCLQAVLATGESVLCTLPQDLQSQLLFKGSGFFVVAPTKSTLALLKPPAAQSAASCSNETLGWAVVYVLADDDPPELARQGLW